MEQAAGVLAAGLAVLALAAAPLTLWPDQGGDPRRESATTGTQ